MPIYEYECTYHGVFEVEQRITEDALDVCPKPVKVEGERRECCAPIKRLISLTNFTWKGGAPTPKNYV